MADDPPTDHFFKFVPPGFLFNLSIPTSFLTKLNGERCRKATLRRGHHVWSVDINDDGVLGDGWRRFVRENGVQEFDFIVFKHQGGMVFDSMVFDQSTCERQYPNLLSHEMDVEEPLTESDTFHALDILKKITRKSTSEATKKSTAKDSTSRKRKASEKNGKKQITKLQDENTDSDFENSESKKKGKKNKNILEPIRKRSSPRAILTVIKGLSKKQKLCVQQMGFGVLLKMKMTDVPGPLLNYVLSNFSSNTMKIKVQNGEIDVSRESVHRMLGLPLGEIKFDKLPFRTAEDTCYEEWLKQFGNKKLIQLNTVKKQICLSKRADMNFKMNFICVMVNALLESSSSGKCNTNPMNYIMRDTEIQNIDWCQYLIDCLVKTKGTFDPKSKTMFFLGPSAYLVLLYVDSVKCDCISVSRKHSVICQWTSDKLKSRESFEKDVLGDFGTGELNEEYVEEDNEDDSDEDEEYDGDVTEMDYITKIDSLLAKALSKYPKNKKLKSLRRALDEIDEEKTVSESEEARRNKEDRDNGDNHKNDGAEGGKKDDGKKENGDDSGNQVGGGGKEGNGESKGVNGNAEGNGDEEVDVGEGVKPDGDGKKGNDDDSNKQVVGGDTNLNVVDHTTKVFLNNENVPEKNDDVDETNEDENVKDRGCAPMIIVEENKNHDDTVKTAEVSEGMVVGSEENKRRNVEEEGLEVGNEVKAGKGILNKIINFFQ